MSVNADSLEVRNNTDAGRFEVQLGDKLGLIKYHKLGSDYRLVHTEVPPGYEGQGIAARMAYVALETIKAEGARIVPDCPFIQSYLRRHREYEPLVIERR